MPGPLAFAPAAVEVEVAPDGTTRLRSPMALRPSPPAITQWLEDWAAAAPDRPFLAERDGEGWRRVTYGDALTTVRQLAQGLLDRGLSAARPVVLLSENGIDHALLTLAALHVGIPAVQGGVAAALRAMAADAGGASSMCVTRALILVDPPPMDGDEITDKGYINQAAVLARRAHLVEALYRGGDDVILP